MVNVDIQWIVGWVGTVTIAVGILLTINYVASDNNNRYYESMNKCIASGGSFIPTFNSNAICLMGVKQ
jgi:hypothetical protein